MAESNDGKHVNNLRRYYPGGKDIDDDIEESSDSYSSDRETITSSESEAGAEEQCVETDSSQEDDREVQEEDVYADDEGDGAEERNFLVEEEDDDESDGDDIDSEIEEQILRFQSATEAMEYDDTAQGVARPSIDESHSVDSMDNTSERQDGCSSGALEEASFDHEADFDNDSHFANKEDITEDNTIPNVDNDLSEKEKLIDSVKVSFESDQLDKTQTSSEDSEEEETRENEEVTEETKQLLDSIDGKSLQQEQSIDVPGDKPQSKPLDTVNDIVPELSETVQYHEEDKPKVDESEPKEPDIKEKREDERESIEKLVEPKTSDTKNEPDVVENPGIKLSFSRALVPAPNKSVVIYTEPMPSPFTESAAKDIAFADEAPDALHRETSEEFPPPPPPEALDVLEVAKMTQDFNDEIRRRDKSEEKILLGKDDSESFEEKELSECIKSEKQSTYEQAASPDSSVEVATLKDKSPDISVTPDGHSSGETSHLNIPLPVDPYKPPPKPARSPSTGIEQDVSDIEITGDNSHPTTPRLGVFLENGERRAPLGTESVESLEDEDVSLSPPVIAQSHMVIVAIDFGTTLSGYAFSFARDPDSIHMMRKWEGGDPGVINQKTPTCILLDPEGKFHSFGFSARDFYHDLHPQEAKKWMFFDRFKMLLHDNSELDENTKIQSVNGREMSALMIFSHSLRYFKDHALQELSDETGTRLLSDDVKWVLTVPAIWRAPAKQFMRQAAYQAGLASADYPEQLVIALEPEAASIHCRRLKMCQLVSELPASTYTMSRATRASAGTWGSARALHVEGGKSRQRATGSVPRTGSLNWDEAGGQSGSLSVLPHTDLTTENTVGHSVRGSRYVVTDCGGGTVDITVHELQAGDGSLRELYHATGGPYGSTGVDEAFVKLLEEIFGTDFLAAFKNKRPAGYVDLMIAFESRKRAASPWKLNPLNVSLPFSFIDYYKRFKGSSVESAVKKYNDQEVKWSSQGFLRLTSEAMRRLFWPTLEQIKRAIGQVLNIPEVKGVSHLFLVGGFAESPLLQQEIKREFSRILRVVIPLESGLAILKGAVQFGLNPGIINIRRSRAAYGVGVLNRFESESHPKKKRVVRDGVVWCKDVLDKFVELNQPVALGDSVIRCYTPAGSRQKLSIINIFTTENPRARFTTDAGVRKCGSLVLDLSDVMYEWLPRRREIQARMMFGDTEIKVTAMDVATGKMVRASVDFFNRQ